MPRPPVLAVLAFACLAAGCKASEPTEPSRSSGGSSTALSVDVTMPGTSFRPNRIDIAQGGVLRFVFSALPHDVRFSGASAPADIAVTSNATVTRTFPAKGTYSFLCSLHANMSGTVVVH
ncbi:MAG: hypothetical protein C0497_00850 [Gemmatimonas sp.]|nr:hypothetical protein [Gemmatimonas sp.]